VNEAGAYFTANQLLSTGYADSVSPQPYQHQGNHMVVFQAGAQMRYVQRLYGLFFGRGERGDHKALLPRAPEDVTARLGTGGVFYQMRMYVLRNFIFFTNALHLVGGKARGQTKSDSFPAGYAGQSLEIIQRFRPVKCPFFRLHILFHFKV
jgi:hypothetical protein